MPRKQAHKEASYKLPHGHLSWSAMDLVERDPIEYARSYILGEPRFESEAMLFGKQFAEEMAAGAAGPDSDERRRFLISIGMPRLELPEHRIEATHNGLKLVGILDTCASDHRTFREYKSGRAPWTQGRVDSHGQLSFYAALIWLTKGFLPTECWLDWVPTTIDPETGDLTATGEVVSFKRSPFTLLDVVGIIRRAERAAGIIDGLVKEYQNTIIKP